MKVNGLSLAVRVYSLILMAYTGWRTLDFMMSQLPKNDLSFWLSVIFLFSAELGLLMWSELAMKHATTEAQEWIAKILAVIDFVGSTAAGTADMVLHQTLLQELVVPVWLSQFLIYGMPLVMAMNVGAVFLFLWFDAEQWIAREKRQTVFEITRSAIEQLQSERLTIAGSRKGMVYQSLKAEVLHLVDSKYGDKRTGQDDSTSLFQLPSKNGVTYNQETPVSLPPGANHQDPTHPG